MYINIRTYLKRFIFYIKSTIWFLRLRIKNHNISTGLLLIKKLGKYKNVHIVCPGPSLNLIKDSKIEKDSLIIFVNHSIDICDNENLLPFRKILFTADVTRANELIKDKKEKFKRFISILFPSHLFHLNNNVFKNYNYIYDLKPKFSLDYGIIAKGLDNPNSLKKPIKHFESYGYGSLCSAITFAQIFDPKYIHFWGCNLYQSNQENYSNLTNAKNYYYGANLPFYSNILLKDISELEKSFQEKGVEFIFNKRVN